MSAYLLLYVRVHIHVHNYIYMYMQFSYFILRFLSDFMHFNKSHDVNALHEHTLRALRNAKESSANQSAEFSRTPEVNKI